MFTGIKAYLYGGILVAFLALGGVMLYYRGEAIDASAKLAMTQDKLNDAMRANEQQQRAIEQIKQWRETDNKTIADLQGRITDIGTKQNEQLGKLRDLERQNAETQAYLSTVIPDALGQLLNRPDAGAGADGDGNQPGANGSN